MFCLNCGEKSTALPTGAGKYRTVRFRRTSKGRIDTKYFVASTMSDQLFFITIFKISRRSSFSCTKMCQLTTSQETQAWR
jgi:hypothetical protein